MSADDNDQTTSENTDNEQKTSSETPELSEEGKEKVRQMQQAYDDDRPTAVLPGTDGTITGVAINEWLDDEGNPKFGKDKQQEKTRKANRKNTPKKPDRRLSVTRSRFREAPRPAGKSRKTRRLRPLSSRGRLRWSSALSC